MAAARSRLPRRAALLIGAAALAAAPALLIAGPAQAHNYLVSSTPEEGGTLTELPDRFEITTNGALLNLGGSTGAFALQVTDADGLYYGDGCLDVTGPSMSTAAALGAPGTYTVQWQVVSADGHSVSDEYAFDWAPSTAGQESTGSATTPVCDDGGKSGSGADAAAGSATDGGGGSRADAAAGSATDGGGGSGASEAGSAASQATTADAVAGSGSGSSDALWIGGAVVAVAAAGGGVLLTRRRARPGTAPEE
jgi:methionine-rich copper-binding protein CopC